MSKGRAHRWPGYGVIRKLGRTALGKSAARPAPDLIVIGLGNPGAEYEHTRHNAGFWAVDELLDLTSTELADRRRTCLLGEGAIGGRRVILAKPRTYVNLSGAAASYLLDRYGVGPERLMVVCDDMDLRPGRLRLRKGGGPGGHNGMRSVTEAIGGRNFARLRIGVGRPEPEQGDVEHVLGRPTDEDCQRIREAVSRVPSVVTGILSEGMERTMDWTNRGAES